MSAADDDRAPREFREATPEDESLIFSSWLRSHHEMGDWPHRLAINRCVLGEGKRCACCKHSYGRYFDEHKHVILGVIKSAQTIVACNPAKRWQVLGFITFQANGGRNGRDLLHWVTVKKFYRRQRIASELMERAGLIAGDIDCSHWSLSAERLSMAGRRLIYDPFVFGGPKE